MRLRIRHTNDSQVEVRTATRTDSALLLACLAGADDYRRRFTQHRSTEEWLDALLDEAEHDEERLLCVATRRDGQPVALLELVRDDPTQLTIALLTVHKTHRVQGFGRRVVKLLGEQLAKGGTTHLALGVAHRNTTAIAFWESLGFATTSVIGSKHDRLVNMLAAIEDLR